MPCVAEVFLGEVVGAQRGRVIGRQRDQVVEDAGLRRRIALEGADALVGFGGQLGAVVVDAHQLGAVIGRHVLSFGGQASKTCWRKFSVQLKLGELL
jgi:hypothetical protein